MLPGKATAHWSVQPLSQSETICTNITFGLPFDADKYEDALRIGVKGLNFSSSQRTRVVIARAVYQAVNIYLLEAVLSAVDSHVGTNIFKACFKKSLKGKLVLLVAHSLSFVSHCDQIVVIADGRIT
ncbi:ATP-binding Cassette (ABC) Superfamily [Phytophthora infestans T30-4]|uniref:ATP-binding Cassette (ABC) Superfamily n=1 Tax=Phytophthora infestans (strain T30-4) TaxID=403677 RepID=D0N5I6_PHYIT|nr:ATP-binding Cassette (ABC) Superfamily [Phytophthora infestans T30-4]EEY70327.1 ATP-binding Cassette (ABC) Superfamily [Phytophthora infestans T30-4]|eukprot:XP_002997981.1 ATP-binding Cassette (ABC) Superfamily [Phytophthora infestans T30-4]